MVLFLRTLDLFNLAGASLFASRMPHVVGDRLDLLRGPGKVNVKRQKQSVFGLHIHQCAARYVCLRVAYLNSVTRR